MRSLCLSFTIVFAYRCPPTHAHTNEGDKECKHLKRSFKQTGVPGSSVNNNNLVTSCYIDI